MIKIIQFFLKIFFSFYTIMAAINTCHAQHLNNLNLLSKQKYLNGKVQITGPYSILANTTYTPDIDSYDYQNYTLKILNRKTPDKIIFQAMQKETTDLSKMSPYSISKITTRRPWWSKLAPPELKNLDFSKVDGKKNRYQIGKNYQLRLLAQQGHWGKVYVLERLSNDLIESEKICAVKLLLTRTDRKLSGKNFRERHLLELQNNLIFHESNMSLPIKPYGIIKNDADHYLLFQEYGESAHNLFKKLTLAQLAEQFSDLITQIDQFHLAGYAHGDLTINNVLFVEGQMKLCDWFSLNVLEKTIVGKYRYIGDSLPPEAMRALYFGKRDNTLQYSIVTDRSQKQFYLLHPITADRFCLAISMLQYLAPDLYMKYETLMPKQFNPYHPESLEFWQIHVTYIRKTQAELLKRASKMKNMKARQLFEKLSHFIEVDPLSRRKVN